MCNDITKLCLPNHLSATVWGLLTATRRHGVSREENKLASISMLKILPCTCKLRIILPTFPVLHFFFFSKEIYTILCKVKVTLKHVIRSVTSLTLEESTPRPCRFTPDKGPAYLLYGGLDWPRESVWTDEENPAHAGFQTLDHPACR